MGTTSKMGIPYPENTDFVADGATAMKNISDQVDAKTGLILIKTQTVGSAATLVTVTNAFSSAYRTYVLTYNGGTASANTLLYLRVGATASGYYNSYIRTSWNNTVAGTGSTSDLEWQRFGRTSTTADNNYAYIHISSPFQSANTRVWGQDIASADGGNFVGFLNNTTSYTDFTMFPASGTITGGTICVYGYNQ